MDDRIEQAQIRIGRRFNDPELVRRALTHASIADTRRDSNERLEFLGDSVLGLVCCERIYSLYPDLLEGEMWGRARPGPRPPGNPPPPSPPGGTSG